MSNWTRCEGTALVQYAFEANGKYQISLAPGEQLQLLKETADWYKGRRLAGAAAGEEGIFPKNYVEVSAAVPPAPAPPPAPTPAPAPAPPHLWSRSAKKSSFAIICRPP